MEKGMGGGLARMSHQAPGATVQGHGRRLFGCLLLLWCWGGAGHAATFDLGMLAGGTTTVLGNGFGSDEPGRFSDTFSFEVPVNAEFVSTLAAENLSFGTLGGWQLEAFGYTLRQGGATLLTGTGADSYSFKNIGVGLPFSLTVEGDVVGSLGAVYGGGISVVPLPPALLLFGSAVFGLFAVARRGIGIARTRMA